MQIKIFANLLLEIFKGMQFLIFNYIPKEDSTNAWKNYTILLVMRVTVQCSIIIMQM